jgi:CheY-like chemotaxis protein
MYDVAQNGFDALKKFQENSYALVLMDIQMHGMDGFETTQNIRRIEREKSLPHTPIMAMTAHAMDQDRERCLQVGMDDYMSKPFAPLELAKKIAELLKGSATPSMRKVAV